MRGPVKDSVPAVTDQTRLISFLAGHSSERNKRAETTMGTRLFVIRLLSDERSTGLFGVARGHLVWESLFRWMSSGILISGIWIIEDVLGSFFLKFSRKYG